MINTLIFDIDGVLVSTRKLHEIALTRALKEYGYNITEKDHKEKYDGLPTKVKLNLLGINEVDQKAIYNLKQKLTFAMAENYIIKNQKLIDLFKGLYKNYNIAICSNAIRSFCEFTLELLGIDLYVQLVLSNEDVVNSKPSPEIYLKAIEYFKTKPKDSIIFEDSKFGLSAGLKSEANVCYIENPSYLTESKVRTYIAIYNSL